jgi:hypothetical protein
MEEAPAMSDPKRTYTLTTTDMDGVGHRLLFSEKTLLEVQKTLNLILNNHGPLAKMCRVGNTIASMEERP